jgi:hypothetical protein
MTEDEDRPATLHNGAVSTDFPTLQDAIKFRCKQLFGPEPILRLRFLALLQSNGLQVGLSPRSHRA